MTHYTTVNCCCCRCRCNLFSR